MDDDSGREKRDCLFERHVSGPQGQDGARRESSYWVGYLAGLIDGEGHAHANGGVEIEVTEADIAEAAVMAANALGLTWSYGVSFRDIKGRQTERHRVRITKESAAKMAGAVQSIRKKERLSGS